VIFGLVADSLGSRRSMTLGLVLLAIVSALGGFAQRVAPLGCCAPPKASVSCLSCCLRPALFADWSSHSRSAR
jgi:MFS family permease